MNNITICYDITFVRNNKKRIPIFSRCQTKHKMKFFNNFQRTVDTIVKKTESGKHIEILNLPTFRESVRFCSDPHQQQNDHRMLPSLSYQRLFHPK